MALLMESIIQSYTCNTHNGAWQSSIDQTYYIQAMDSNLQDCPQSHSHNENHLYFVDSAPRDPQQALTDAAQQQNVHMTDWSV